MNVYHSSKCIFLNENYHILLQNGLSQRAWLTLSALHQVMAWRQTGGKPLPEPMMTKINHWRHIVSLCHIHVSVETLLQYTSIYIREIKARKLTYKSVIWAIIGWANGLLPIWHHGIYKTNNDLLSHGPLQSKFCESRIKTRPALNADKPSATLDP